MSDQNLPLFTPITLTVGTSTTITRAEWEDTLPSITSINQIVPVVLSSPNNAIPAGLYVSQGGTMRFVMDFVGVMNALHNASTVHVYVNAAASIDPRYTVIYHNGVITDIPSVPATGIFATVSNQFGTVRTVNGVFPDSKGDVNLTPTDIGAVASVNNILPDGDGNVTLIQFANYSISLPIEPEAGSTVYFQQLTNDLQYLQGDAAVKVPATDAIVFNITRNGAPIGTVTFAANSSTGVINIPVDTLFSNNDIIEIVAPEDLFGSAVFSLVLTFKRV